MKKITDDIYLIHLPLPFSAVKELSIYYIDGKLPALIDTGIGDAESIEIISSQLRKINRSIKDISFIINTHEHIEHFSGDRTIKEISGGTVIASTSAAQVIENFHKSTEELKVNLPSYDIELTEEIYDIIDQELQVDSVKVDRQIEDGDIIDTGNVKLKAITTPGHAKGHICLYDEESKVLFTGDHIIAKTSTFVGYDFREITSQRILDVFNKSNEAYDHLSLYIDSIKKLELLDIDIILPGHGKPIKEPYKKLEMEIKKKERRSELFHKVLKKKKEISLKQLTREVYGRKNGGFLHMGSALGYLARMNRYGIINVIIKNDEPFIILKDN